MKPAWNPRMWRGENEDVNAKLRTARDLQRLLARIAETGARSREQMRARLVTNAERRARAEKERQRRLSAEIANRRTLAERERHQTQLRRLVRRPVQRHEQR